MANHSILVVLNHDDTRKQIIASLNVSFHLNETDTFANAIEILRTEPIDLIISDISVQDNSCAYASVFDFMRWVKGIPLLVLFHLFASPASTPNSNIRLMDCGQRPAPWAPLST